MGNLKKKQLPLPSCIVSQANGLVTARYTLPLAEQRLILTMIARIQPDDDDFMPYRISIAEFAGYLGIPSGSAYSECKKITKSLLSRVLEIQEGNRLLQTHWVSSAEYIDGTGMVSLTFDRLLKPYLLKLKGNFTSCRLGMLLSFKSQYSVRIYTVLKQYERLNGREIGLVELRDLLGLRQGIHAEYSNFKLNVLKPVQKELLEKSDIFFEFDEIKQGRQVAALVFRSFPNKPQRGPGGFLSDGEGKLSPDSADGDGLEKLLSLVADAHKNKASVLRALGLFTKKQGFDYVKRNILYSNAKADTSYPGFLINALENDWGHDWILEQKASADKKPLAVWQRLGFASQQGYDEHMYNKQMESYSESFSLNGQLDPLNLGGGSKPAK